MTYKTTQKIYGLILDACIKSRNELGEIPSELVALRSIVGQEHDKQRARRYKKTVAELYAGGFASCR